jgi:hypothetical protein
MQAAALSALSADERTGRAWKPSYRHLPFSPGYPAEAIVEQMALNFFDRLAELDPEAPKLTAGELHEKVILASIVEREYRLEKEAPLIASVFVNRLAYNIGLESCATLEYIITDLLDRPHPRYLSEEDKRQSPYNTYLGGMQRDNLNPGGWRWLPLNPQIILLLRPERRADRPALLLRQPAAAQLGQVLLSQASRRRGVRRDRRMRIPDRLLAQITERLDAAEVVSQYTRLEKRGGRYWGLCPFHTEKTPSFTVTPDKAVFYCFGCQKGGSLFTFVMEAEKLSFLEAVRLLAAKAGVELELEEDEDAGRRKAYLELYRRVAGSLHYILLNHAEAGAARAYLEGRGFRRETLERFHVGYAPPGRDWLFGFLRERAFRRSSCALRAFLQLPGGGPVACSGQAKVLIGTAGRNRRFRRLEPGRRPGPQYLNTPETAFFARGAAVRESACSRPCARRAASCWWKATRMLAAPRRGVARLWLWAPAHHGAGAPAEALRSNRRPGLDADEAGPEPPSGQYCRAGGPARKYGTGEV